MKVVREFESGAKIIERVALPEPTDFESPDKRDAFLDAVRWGAAWTENLQNLVSDVVAVPYKELRHQQVHQKQLFVDESPAPECQGKAWLCEVVAPLLAVFGIFPGRSRETLVSLIGN